MRHWGAGRPRLTDQRRRPIVLRLGGVVLAKRAVSLRYAERSAH
jgi:hypothetical protein